MPASEREQIRACGQYLREVRPIDPENVSEYVDSQPHPAVVRQILREEAISLEIVERADGSFEPVDAGTISPAFDPPTRLPTRYAAGLEALLVDAYGSDWHRGDSGRAIRERIRKLKADYYQQRAVEYDSDTALAYACYHLPNYYAVSQYAYDELGSDGLLASQLRVLDVGAGVGGPALGLDDYLPADTLVDYHAIEPSDATDVLETLLEMTGVNTHTTIHETTAEAFELEGEYDLLLFANVLGELENPVETVERYLDALAPDGTLLALAPADRNRSLGLRETERELVDVRERATGYAPTVRLWADETPTGDCWSFAHQPEIEAPAYQRDLASRATAATEEMDGGDGPDAFTNTTINYAWSALRTDGRERVGVDLERSRAAPLAESPDLVSNRLDFVVAKLSPNLQTEGHPLFLVSDGSESVAHFAVCVKETTLNDALRRANYGDILSIESGLLLYNDDESAYNIVADEETIVDRT